jgi:hypothetical protein
MPAAASRYGILATEAKEAGTSPADLRVSCEHPFLSVLIRSDAIGGASHVPCNAVVLADLRPVKSGDLSSYEYGLTRRTGPFRWRNPGISWKPVGPANTTVAVLLAGLTGVFVTKC